MTIDTAPATALLPHVMTSGTDVHQPFRLASQAGLYPSDAKKRASANAEALALCAQLEAEHRRATPDEQQTIARFSGWGALSHLFDGDPDWDDVRPEVEAWVRHMSWAHPQDGDPWDIAREATLNSHYTDVDLAVQVWRLLEGLGLRNHDDGTPIRVMEPGCGSGVFLSTAPLNLGLEWHAVDIDPSAVRVAKALHPEADIRCAPFESVPYPDGHFDLVVGNVPYGKYAVLDPRHNRNGWRIHYHFAYKAVMLTRPGGLVAIYNSAFFLNSVTTQVRTAIDEVADLVCAIRFPNGTFQAAAGTNVIEDLLVFRRRPEGELPILDRAKLEDWPDPENWLVSENRADRNGDKWRTNAGMSALGFPDNGGLPYMKVIGRETVARGAHKQAEYTVKLEAGAEKSVRKRAWALFANAAIPDVLGRAADRVPYVPPVPDEAALGDNDWEHRWDDELDQRKDGSIHLSDTGSLVRIDQGRAVPFKPNRSSDTAEVKALVQLRDCAVAALAAMVKGESFHSEQEALHAAYDAYTAHWGFLNRYREFTRAVTDPDTGEVTLEVRRTRPTMGGFNRDPDYFTVLALEVWDEATRTATKGPIFFENVVGQPQDPKPTSVAEALAVSLNERAGVDPGLIANLLDRPTDQVEAELREGDQAYEDPATGCWLPASVYLAGDVRTKLDIAHAAAQLDDRYARNVPALAAVVPPDLGPEEIDLRLGSPLLDTGDVEAFAAEHFGECTVEHIPSVATWTVEAERLVYGNVRARAEHGTHRAHAFRVLEWALNLKTAAVYDEIEVEPGKKRLILNREETEAAQVKLDAMGDLFASWLWTDPERTAKYVDRYNRKANCWAAPRFDGSHLTLPGLSPAWSMRPHQKDAIWRALVEGGMVLAHSVGLGKAQPGHAKVLTPAGFRRMDELGIGDEVIAADGTVTNITGVFPQGELDNYRVTFTDGSTVECNDEHLWQVRYAEQPGRSKFRQGGWKVLPLLQIMREMEGYEYSNGKVRFFVPMAEPANLDTGLDRPLDPYFLGILLGDGSLGRDSIKFSSADEEIVKWMTEACPAPATVVKNTASAIDYRCTIGRIPRGTPTAEHRNPVVDAVRSLGLRGHGAFEKFVPESYKLAPAIVRLEILRGLMDSDGYVHLAGTTQFNSRSERLARDVQWLVQSLGGVGRFTSRQVEGKPAYNVTIRMPEGVCPFRLTRKAERYGVGSRGKYGPSRGIKSVERIGREQMQCISVAHSSRLYVTDEFVVTHNTAVMVSSAVEMRRLGIAGKPLIVVPNHMLEQIAREARQLYPAARMLVCTAADASKDGRRAFIARCATGNWDLVVMTHSAFGLIPLSREARKRYLTRRLATLRRAKAEAGGTVKKIEEAIKRLEVKLKQALTSAKDEGGLTFEELGVDHVMMDEAHLFKNLDHGSSVVQSSGSKRAEDLASKIDWLTDRYGDFSHRGPLPQPGARRRRAILATGTPVANTIAELWVMHRFADYPALCGAGYELFDGWYGAFGQTVARLEVSPDGGGFKIKQRPARFRNVPELMALWLLVADVRSLKTVQGIDVPDVVGGRRRTVIVPPSTGTQRFVAELMVRAKALEDGLPQERPKIVWEKDENGNRHKHLGVADDNMLWVVGDGAKAALDLRLVGQNPDPQGGKIAAVAEQVARVYHATKGNTYGTRQPGALQLVFCDLGVNPADRCLDCGYPEGQGPKDCAGCAEADAAAGMSVYERVRIECARMGVPYQRIRFMKEADNDQRKASLFAACRDGLVSVLIGSTERMGVGTNVQDRAVALHHLDAPWRPCDIEQREGRVVRQGNLNGEVELLVYVAEGTFDAFKWQTLETKAGFIEQIVSGTVTARTVDDVGETTMSFAEIKAAASGNPIILDHAKAQMEVKRLRLKRASHQREMSHLDWLARDLAGRRRELGDEHRQAKADLDRVAVWRRSNQVPDDAPLTFVAQRPHPDAKASLLEDDPQERMVAWINWWREDRDMAGRLWKQGWGIGSLGPFLLKLRPQGKYTTFEQDPAAVPLIEIDTAGGKFVEIGARDRKLPQEVNWAERLRRHLGDLAARVVDLEARIEAIDAELAQARAKLAAPFDLDDELEAAEALVEELADQMKAMTELQVPDPDRYEPNPPDTVDWAALERDVASRETEALEVAFEALDDQLAAHADAAVVDNAAAAAEDGWEDMAGDFGETDAGQAFLFPDMGPPPKTRGRRRR